MGRGVEQFICCFNLNSALLKIIDMTNCGEISGFVFFRKVTNDRIQKLIANFVISYLKKERKYELTSLSK